MREYWENIALGALQGLTEFLPVSSSGHLVALETVIGSGGQEDLTREIFLHFATVLSVVVVFRRELAAVLQGALSGGAGRSLFLKLALACIPAGAVGFLAKSAVEKLPSRWPFVVSVCWLVMALVLFTLRRSAPRDERAVDIGWGLAIWIGGWQILALLPGISRAGITIAAALWLGARPRDAASFSFLLSVPLILAAAGLQITDAGGGLHAVGPLVAGGVTAFVTGLIALKLLLRMLIGGSLHLWSYYLVTVAVLYGGWLFTGAA